MKVVLFILALFSFASILSYAGVSDSGKSVLRVDRSAQLGATSKIVSSLGTTVSVGGAKASGVGLIAKLKTQSKNSVSVMESTLSEHGLVVESSYKSVPGLKRLTLQAGKGSKALSQDSLSSRIAELKATGLFEYVEPDWKVSIYQDPTDTAFTNGTLWGLQNTGQSGGVSGIDVNAVAAWSITTGDPSVIVGVIDTGIRYTHRDLAGNMWVNAGEIAGNGIDDDSNGYIDDIYGINAITESGDPFDDNNHGTHCAGTIAATAFDSGQHVGVAYGVQLMGLKFMGSDGSGNISDAIACVDYAIQQGVDILSNSWGGGGYSQAMHDVIEAANDAGILFLAAAGNSSSNNDVTDSYPANYDIPNVVSVAAVDRRGSLANFSSYGASKVDIGAPGVAIFSTTAESDTSYDSYQGTSMATPHVAGVAALIVSRYPDASLEEVKNRLLVSATPLQSLSGVVATGGIADAYAALTYASDGMLEVVASSEDLLDAGVPGNFYISVTDLSAVVNATVTAYFDGGSAVNFLNNGVTPDAHATDAIYSAQLTPPSGVSTVNLNIEASAPGKTTTNVVVPFTIVTRPSNDDFDDRSALAAGTTQTYGSNENASFESGEARSPSVAGEHSVWWEWTASTTGEVVISTTGSDYDTTLAIYNGNSFGALSLVGSNDDFNGYQSAVTFSATAGVTYQVQVNGYSSEQGAIQLNYPSPGEGSSDLPSIITQPVGRSIIIGDSFELSVIAGGEAPLTYQWYLDNEPISGEIAANLNVDASAESDEGYYSVVITNDFGSVTSNSAFVSIDPVGLSPNNDNFSDAEQLSGTVGNVDGSNVRATGEAAEPTHASESSAPVESVWYYWTAPAEGSLVVDTQGSDFDTVLAVYSGSSLETIVELASNDDSDGLQSTVSIPVSAGVIYMIAVDGFSSSEGLISLNYTFSGGPPESNNDAFADRILLRDSTDVTGSNSGASGEDGEPNHANVSSPLASVWWELLAPVDGNVIISTVGSDFDTALAVYTGSSIDSLSLVASNDDYEDHYSQVSFVAATDTRYMIAVDGYSGDEGTVALSVQVLEDHHGDSLETATNIESSSTTAGNIGISDDLDYFRIEVNGSDTLHVRTTGNTDTYGYLMKSDGTVLVESDDSVDYNFSISYDLTPGTYYVCVEGYDSYTVGSYQLVSTFGLSLLPADSWDSDDGSPPNFSTAGLRAGVETTHGAHTLSPNDTADWHRFYLWEGRTYSFWSNGSDDVKAELYADMEGTQLVASDDNSGGNGQFDLEYTPSESQQYYLRISTAAEGQNAEYTFLFEGGLNQWYFESADLGSSWVWLSWLGSFSIVHDPWIYHYEHGWLFPFADDSQSVYFWDDEMKSIVWTSEDVYPAMYRFSDSKWLYYDLGSDNPRWFVDLVTGEWEQW